MKDDRLRVAYYYQVAVINVEVGIVLNLFINLGRFEPLCSYKSLFLYEKKVYPDNASIELTP